MTYDVKVIHLQSSEPQNDVTFRLGRMSLEASIASLSSFSSSSSRNHPQSSTSFSFTSSPSSSVASSIFLSTPKPLEPIIASEHCIAFMQVDHNLCDQDTLVEEIESISSTPSHFLSPPSSSEDQQTPSTPEWGSDSELADGETSSKGQKTKIKRRKLLRRSSDRLPWNALPVGSSPPRRPQFPELDDYTDTSSFAPCSPRFRSRLFSPPVFVPVPTCTCSPDYDDSTTTTEDEEEEVISAAHLPPPSREVEVWTRIKKKALVTAGIPARSRGW